MNESTQAAEIAQPQSSSDSNWWCRECVLWHPKDMGGSPLEAHAEWERRAADSDEIADCGSNAPDWCFDGTCSTCVGGHLVSEFVYRHADDGAECLWDAGEQKWVRMHPLYPIRECTRSHGAVGERSCSCGTGATSLNPTEVVVHGPERCTIEPVIPPAKQADQ